MVSRLAVILAALLCALSVPTAWAADDPTWTAEPAAGTGTGPDNDGRPYVYLEGLPGTVLEDRLSLTNPGPKPLTVRLRSADAYNTEGGALAVRGAQQSRGTGAWISLAEDRVTIPPRTRAEVPFSVTVPTGAVPGDHPGAIMAASAGREAGVRIHLRVSGPTLAALTVEDVSVSRGEIHYALVNRGNTALVPRLAVRADGFFGELLNRPARPLPLELLPGQRVTLTENWPGPSRLDSVDVRLSVTAAGNASGGASASAWFVPWPWVAAAAPALSAATGVVLWLVGRGRVRRRRGTGDRRQAGSAQEEHADGRGELTGAAR